MTNQAFPTVEIEISGRYALFSDPIIRTSGEKFTYPLPTYEALKNIMCSIYWKPTFIWIIDAVRIMNPIHTETKNMLVPKWQGASDRYTQTVLTNVKYQVRAHIEWNYNRPQFEQDRNIAKHMACFNRALKAGGRYPVFLGIREYQCEVKECIFGADEGYYDTMPDTEYGVMLHGITYSSEAYTEHYRHKDSVRLFCPHINKGVIQFPHPADFEKKSDMGISIQIVNPRAFERNFPNKKEATI